VRSGRRLAIDVGKVRVGLAISDQSGILASPLATIKRHDSNSETIDALLGEIAEYSLLEIYVGLPISLSGDNTASTQDAIDLALELEKRLSTPIRFIDERLTTVSATANLRQHGISAKNQRKIIDQEAAALILENALNQERVQGTPPGRSPIEL
jgi:putative Holliday junction resolvase